MKKSKPPAPKPEPSPHQITYQDAVEAAGGEELTKSGRRFALLNVYSLPNARQVIITDDNRVYLEMREDFDLLQQELLFAGQSRQLDDYGKIIEAGEVTTVEVQRGIDGRLWINLDGKVALRVAGCDELITRDIRQLGPGHLDPASATWPTDEVDTGEAMLEPLEPLEPLEDLPDDADWQRAERYGKDAEGAGVSSAGTVLIDGGDPCETISVVVGVVSGGLATEDVSDGSQWVKAPAYVLVAHRDGSRRLDRIDKRGIRRQVYFARARDARDDHALASAYVKSVQEDAISSPKSSE